MVNRLKSTTQDWCLLAEILVAAFFFFVAAAPLVAGPHRARVSADLADHLTAGSQNIDVIVHGEKAEVDALSARYNLKIKRYLKSGAVLHVNAGQLAALRDDDTVDHLSGDIRIQSTVDAATAESIGADQVWAGTDRLPPLTGQGVSVAVIDSGIDTRHNSLRKRVLAMHDFTGGDGMDRYGHGTHVAGIIAGQVGRTADTREYRGIASGAYLVNLRVLGDDGSGTSSDVIEAIDWAVEHRREYNIRVINLSLGAPVLQPYRDDPLCEAVERAVRRASRSSRRQETTAGPRMAERCWAQSCRLVTAPTRSPLVQSTRMAPHSGPMTRWHHTAQEVRQGTTSFSNRTWRRQVVTSSRLKLPIRISPRLIRNVTLLATDRTPSCSSQGPAWQRVSSAAQSRCYCKSDRS